MQAQVRLRSLVGSDGLRIAVREYGNPSGPPIVFIHGYLGSHLVFARQVRSELAERHRLVTYDVRGHGESDKPADPSMYTRNESWSNDLHAVIEHLGLERPVLVGWSMGGRVAANYLYTHGTARVGGVNFVNTPTLADPRRPNRGPEGGVGQETISSDWETLIHATARFIRACTAVPMTGADFDLMFGAAMAVPLVARRGCFQWHVDYGDALSRLAVPVLATHGLSDRLLLPAASEAIRDRMQDVTLSLIPEVGHMPFWENPARFNSELAAFVARCAGAR